MAPDVCSILRYKSLGAASQAKTIEAYQEFYDLEVREDIFNPNVPLTQTYAVRFTESMCITYAFAVEGSTSASR